VPLVLTVSCKAACDKQRHPTMLSRGVAGAPRASRVEALRRGARSALTAKHAATPSVSMRMSTIDWWRTGQSRTLLIKVGVATGSCSEEGVRSEVTWVRGV